MAQKNIGEVNKRWFLLEQDGDVVLFGLSDPFRAISTPLNFQGFNNKGDLKTAVDGLMGTGWFDSHYDADSRMGSPNTDPVAESTSEWVEGKFYEEDDVVLFSTIEFTCIKSHRSKKRTPANNPSRWSSSVNVEDWKGSSNVYMRGGLVEYQNSVYVCLQNHISRSNLRPTSAPLFWAVNTGQEVEPNDDPIVVVWKANIDFNVGDWAEFQGGIYDCLIAHQSKHKSRPDKDTGEWSRIA